MAGSRGPCRPHMRLCSAAGRPGIAQGSLSTWSYSPNSTCYSRCYSRSCSSCYCVHRRACRHSSWAGALHERQHSSSPCSGRPCCACLACGSSSCRSRCRYCHAAQRATRQATCDSSRGGTSRGGTSSTRSRSSGSSEHGRCYCRYGQGRQAGRSVQARNTRFYTPGCQARGQPCGRTCSFRSGRQHKQ